MTAVNKRVRHKLQGVQLGLGKGYLQRHVTQLLIGPHTCKQDFTKKTQICVKYMRLTLELKQITDHHFPPQKPH